MIPSPPTVYQATKPAQILERMACIIRRHAADVAEWGLLSLPDFFALVKDGGYNREPLEWRTQVLARPAATIAKTVPVTACANKAIIMSAWAEMNRIPWRLVAVGRLPGYPPHHVYPELLIGGEWRPVDATYPWNVLFAEKPYPVRIEYDPSKEAPACRS